MSDRQRNYFSRLEQFSIQLQAMWQDPRVQLYNDFRLPDDLDKVSSVFLVGPTSRNQILELNWRSEAVKLLRQFGFTGWIFCPEPRGEARPGGFDHGPPIHKWVYDRLTAATHIAFWNLNEPDDLVNLGIFLGLATRARLDGQQLFVGGYPGVEPIGFVEYYLVITGTNYYTGLQMLCEAISAAPRQWPDSEF